jgi:hypothetical protein
MTCYRKTLASTAYPSKGDLKMNDLCLGYTYTYTHILRLVWKLWGVAYTAYPPKGDLRMNDLCLGYK